MTARPPRTPTVTSVRKFAVTITVGSVRAGWDRVSVISAALLTDQPHNPVV